jgi:hypothetical protein
MYYAGRVVVAPLDAPRFLVKGYNSTPETWIYPVPLRIGHYYGIAAFMKLFGLPPERAGVDLSMACSILQLAVVALMGLRFFNRWAVLATLALLSVSPWDLEMSRRVWGDGVCGPLAMVIVWLCAEICVRQRKGPWFAALWICSVYFLLIKETGGFFYGFCVLGLAVESWLRERSWKRVAWISGGAVGTALCSFAIMTALCGGLSAALETIRHNAQSTAGNVYATVFQNGPWYSFPIGLWVLSPLSAFGAALGLVALIRRRDSLGDVLSLTKNQRMIATGMGALIVLVIAMATVPAQLKNLRYISFILGPWYLMAGLGLSYLVAGLRKLLGERATVPVMGVAVLVVVASCWSDYSGYRELFLRRGAMDLNIRQVVTFPFETGG